MKSRILVWGVLLLAVTMVAGCAQNTDTQDEPAEAAAEAPIEPAVFEVTAEMQAKLAAADRVDGTEDQIVSGCPGCGLAMDGKAELAVPVGDYEVRFCSAHCKDSFSKDVTGAVMAMAIPGEAAAPTEGHQ